MAATGAGQGEASSRVGRGAIVAIAVTIAAMVGLLWWMGRVPTCACGTVKLWHGEVYSPENSQQLSDWYSFSHIIHGLIFYGLYRLFPHRSRLTIGLAVATLIEVSWELLENSPIIINRYREATIAIGYTGDSIVNSLSDVAMMMLGFLVASRLPGWATALLALALELLALAVVRDNLTLNVLMLVAPNDAIRSWQAG